LTAGAPRQLYTSLFQQGVRHWYVFPLQLLSDQSTDREVLQCEQLWIQRYRSLVPNGFNHRNACTPVAGDDGVLFHRHFGSRDLCRRVYACYQAHRDQPLTGATAHEFFAHYHRKTLIKLQAFCHNGCHDAVQSATYPYGDWQVPTSFITLLQQWIHQRLQLNDAPAPVTCHRKVVVCSYWNPVCDALNLSGLLHDPTALQLLPAHWNGRPPALAFKYAKPLGLLWCNAASIF
jgi:hypothetical protein